jgi:transposase InsO family protein
VGLDDKPRTRKRLAFKTTMEAMRRVRELQRNPELGAFRVHAALKREGIVLSPRTCGRIMALNRALYGLGKPKRAPKEKRAMPFAAQRRHQFWSVDIRYLDTPLLEGKAYAITILENFSRAIVASMVSPTQDLAAYLKVLRHRLGSDRGSPNHGSTLLSKRVMAQIRSPARVST